MVTGKTDGSIAGGDAALLVIDLQPDFMPGGALAVAEGDAVVAPIAAFMRRWRQSPDNGPIVATQDWHPPGHISFASRHQNRCSVRSN